MYGSPNLSSFAPQKLAVVLMRSVPLPRGQSHKLSEKLCQKPRKPFVGEEKYKWHKDKVLACWDPFPSPASV